VEVHGDIDGVHKANSIDHHRVGGNSIASLSKAADSARARETYLQDLARTAFSCVHTMRVMVTICEAVCVHKHSFTSNQS